MNKRLGRIATGGIVAILLGIIGSQVIDRMTVTPKRVTEVETIEVVAGMPSPFGYWTAFRKHNLTFNDGSKSAMITRDHDYPLLKRLVGYNTPNPKEGDRYNIGGFLGMNHGKAK